MYGCCNVTNVSVLGTVAKDCGAAADVCGHCSGAHESRACPNKSDARRCHNCVGAKMVSSDHSVFDAFACSILQRRLKDTVRMIKY